MSFGTPQGRSPFGGKRSSTQQKKDRRRKQEFHKHKIRLEEETQVDLESLKAKVILSLEKLGQQTFSLEPGGYTFESWMKSLNLLLDDFEEKAGPRNLPAEYFQKRTETTETLLRPADISDIDSQIAEARDEETNINERIRELNAQIQSARSRGTAEISSKVVALRKYRKQYSMELKSERGKLAQKQGAESSSPSSSVSFLRRVFSFGKLLQNSNDNSSATSSAETRINDLEEKIEVLDEKISGLEREKKDSDVAGIVSHEEELREQKQKLEHIRSELLQLETAKLEKMQLSERRKEATKMMSDAISQINLINSQASQ